MTDIVPRPRGIALFIGSKREELEAQAKNISMRELQDLTPEFETDSEEALKLLGKRDGSIKQVVFAGILLSPTEAKDMIVRAR